MGEVSLFATKMKNDGVGHKKRSGDPVIARDRLIGKTGNLTTDEHGLNGSKNWG
jgi:hypothetical protein